MWNASVHIIYVFDATVSVGPSLCSVTDGTPSFFQTKVDIIILKSKLVF